MGRHIDADLVYNAIQITSDKFGILRVPIEQTFRSMLSDIPTAEEPEFKQGEWINEEAELLGCSICHKKIFTIDKFNYCPNCGAKLIESKNNDNDIPLPINPGAYDSF